MSEHLPKVSVIIPTYNRARFVCKAVQSALDQSYGNLEVLIVDDGSTDDTRSVIEAQYNDSRVFYIYQENRGQNGARNTALERATGDLICFLDSDNWWLPGKLEKQVEVMRNNPDVDVCYGDIIVVDEEGKEIHRNNLRRFSGFITRELLRDNCVSINTSMLRRHCIERTGLMDEKRRVAGDYDFWLRLSAEFRFHYMPEYLTCYRVMEDQISTDKHGRFVANEAILHDFRTRFPEALSAREFNRGFAFFYMRKARYLGSIGRRWDALKTLGKALSYDPIGRAQWRAVAVVILKGRAAP